ncbi:MAG: hypothetical protein JNK87_17245 [Bryobacterales bacterium]|nr:hypothetical protein [Bryobacterales bacterium]
MSRLFIAYLALALFHVAVRQGDTPAFMPRFRQPPIVVELGGGGTLDTSGAGLL